MPEAYSEITLSNMRKYSHSHESWHSQNSLFRSFQAYSGLFSNIKPCSDTMKEIKTY